MNKFSIPIVLIAMALAAASPAAGKSKRSDDPMLKIELEGAYGVTASTVPGEAKSSKSPSMMTGTTSMNVLFTPSEDSFLIGWSAGMGQWEATSFSVPREVWSPYHDETIDSVKCLYEVNTSSLILGYRFNRLSIWTSIGNASFRPKLVRNEEERTLADDAADDLLAAKNRNRNTALIGAGMTLTLLQGDNWDLDLKGRLAGMSVLDTETIGSDTVDRQRYFLREEVALSLGYKFDTTDTGKGVFTGGLLGFIPISFPSLPIIHF